MTDRLIENDAFAFEFLSQLAERESWRKEVHRPIYHIHKWWAKRLGSVFRGILLGAVLPPDADVASAFFRRHAFTRTVVWDPFMGSGTTVGEAHKLGMIALGRDINPVAERAVRVALGPVSLQALQDAFVKLEASVGRELRALYASTDSEGRPAEVLYWFWVMQAPCASCHAQNDLFASYVIARNAYPDRKPEVQILCAKCGHIFGGLHGTTATTCPKCAYAFDPSQGPAAGAKATCVECAERYTIIDALRGRRPDYRLYGKLLLRSDGTKEYVPASSADIEAFANAESRLREGEATGAISIPTLALSAGHNTSQALRYGFKHWRDFFNARQLLALARLRAAIEKVEDVAAREALLVLFSGVLEFNNLFASYKGEGTGAVRHMFAHHILKPERTPIEANVWGTRKSSGAFTTLYKSRLLRALGYRLAPTEVRADNIGLSPVCSEPMTRRLSAWPTDPRSLGDRSVALSCGDSALAGLASGSVDLVVTDPPFFDNVHYSELADFFFAWHQHGTEAASSRRKEDVQDTNVTAFTEKLAAVLGECARTLTDDGLLIFTYHHSRDEGWSAVGEAILDAGFVVVNAHPVKAEMSVAAPKSQAKEPIQLDVILVCKRASRAALTPPSLPAAIQSALNKLERLKGAGFKLSRNDERVVVSGQLLTRVRSLHDVIALGEDVDNTLHGVTDELTLVTAS